MTDNQGQLFGGPSPNVKATKTFLLGAPRVEDGRALRDEALARVDEHAAPDWKAIADGAVRELARTRVEFTTDDVWEAIGERAATHEPRALGAVMQRLARHGVIRNTGRVVQSRLPRRHARPVAVWRSVR